MGDFPTNFQFLSYSKSGAVDCIELDISLSSGARSDLYKSLSLFYIFFLIFNKLFKIILFFFPISHPLTLPPTAIPSWRF